MKTKLKLWILFAVLSISYNSHAQKSKASFIKIAEGNIFIEYSSLYKEDSLRTNHQYAELFLLIGQEMSMFTDKNMYEFQKAENKQVEIQPNLWGLKPEWNDKLDRAGFMFVINKNYLLQTLSFYERIMPTDFMYEEKLYDFRWKLTNEQQEIIGYNCQKAVCEYGGRTWIAWFSYELPYNDGPYKFGGLPGLIVKLYDSKEHYIFEMQSIERLAEPANIEIRDVEYVKTNRTNFLKAQENFKKDIVIRAQAAQIQSNETLRTIANNVKDLNNPIELK
ncbi:MAG: GLPGLI family protein [Bacteroidales bacterium]|nr:GLPGLI family protein [Bacteroidales bacterium]